MKNLLVEGIRLKGGRFVFDFKTDKPKDIIYLQWANNKSVGKTTGIKAYYAYRFNKGAKPDQISALRKSLKSSDLISPQDKQLMINKAVIGFNQEYKINTFDIVIFPKSSSPLVKEIATKIRGNFPNIIFADENIVKNTIDNIQIDYEGYLKNAKTPEEREMRKKQLDSDFKQATKAGDFQIKKVHAFRKQYFSNYLKFADDTTRQAYNGLKGNVLVVDDYITTGSTLREMLGLVRTLQPQSIVCFFLIK